MYHLLHMRACIHRNLNKILRVIVIVLCSDTSLYHSSLTEQCYLPKKQQQNTKVYSVMKTARTSVLSNTVACFSVLLAAKVSTLELLLFGEFIVPHSITVITTNFTRNFCCPNR